MKPNIQQLLNSTNNFHFCEFTISCKFDEKVQLPSYKGSTFHGGFGWALKETSETLYQEVFESKNASGHTLIKPFVITPPLELTRDYFSNSRFSFGLKLFGKHAKNAQEILISLFIWQKLGIGSTRSKFQIQSIDLKVGGSNLRVYQKNLKPLLMPDSQYLGAQLQHNLAMQKIDISKGALVFIEALTPLKLKKEGELNKTAPELDKFLWAISHRLAGLIHALGDKSNASIQKLLPYTPAINLKADASFYTSIDRYSKSQKQNHQLEGLLGSWCYEIEQEEYFSWLKLGELINIGNKTSFGFGSYQLALGFESQ
jgi:hypothetical protein